mgnify:CR=1 FL=1
MGKKGRMDCENELVIFFLKYIQYRMRSIMRRTEQFQITLSILKSRGGGGHLPKPYDMLKAWTIRKREQMYFMMAVVFNCLI